MKTPSERLLKGVMSYSGLSGGYLDDLIATKFTELCMNSDGQGTVGYAWLADQAYAPLLAPRARAALRQGFQNCTLADDTAKEQDAQNDIRFWKLTPACEPFEYDKHDALTVISEIAIDKEENKTISFMDVELAKPDDLEQSQQQAIAADKHDDSS